MRKALSIVFALIILGGAVAAQTPLQYKGRFFGTAVQFKIKLERFSTREEIMDIKVPLMSRDFKGFYEKLWPMNVGQIQFIGTNLTNHNFQVALDKPTEKGRRIVLIADSRAILNNRTTTEWGLRPFYIVELTLDDKFQGEGRIHSRGTIKFLEDGTIDLDSYTGEPQMLSQVRSIK